MTKRNFPVLWQGSPSMHVRLEQSGCPRCVPWSVVAQHEKQAQHNHNQTLERLAQRGGLSPWELVALLASAT